MVLELLPKMLSTNQIVISSHHQYIWKESINTWDFLHGDNYQGKLGSETTTFGCMWPVKLLIQEDFRTRRFLLKECINIYFVTQCLLVAIQPCTEWIPVKKIILIFCTDLSRLGSTSKYQFWLSVASCVSHPIRLQDSLVSNITGKNWSVSFVFEWRKSLREGSI